MKIQFIKYSNLWLGFAAVTTIVAVAMMVMWGFKPGIDFTGGSLLELSFSKERPLTAEVEKITSELGLSNSVVQSVGNGGIIVRTSFLNEEKHQEFLTTVATRFSEKSGTVTEKRFETIGAAVSKNLRERSLWATIMVSTSIILYLAYAFRSVNRPIASWKYGLIAILTLLYVVVIVSGVFAALGKFLGVEIDIAYVVAILTVLGYSVNDSIVVYDRIREHLLKRSVENFGELVNTGLNETLARSVNTVGAVLLPLIALFFFGGSTIHYFSLALLLGMALSTFASIFVASPLLVLLEKRQRLKKA